MGKRKKNRFPIYDYDAVYQSDIDQLHELFLEQMLKDKHKSFYALKEIKAGDQLEVEIYPEFTKKEDIPEAGRIKPDAQAQKNLNDKRSRKRLTRLLNNNFFNGDIWLTLTYAAGKEPDSMERAMKDIKNYIERVRRRRKKEGIDQPFKYVYIVEYDPEEDIRWHFHVLMDGALSMETVEDLWGKASRNEVRKIRRDETGITGLANYISKAKDKGKSQKKWASSKNLVPPEEKKVYHKKSTAKGNYKPISKYVAEFVRDQQEAERRLKLWYPQYIFTDVSIKYNEINHMFYIYARMRTERINAKCASA